MLGIGPQAQCPVVDVARTSERPRQDGGLFGRRVKPMAICALLPHADNDCATGVSRQGGIVLLGPWAAPGGARRFIPIGETRGLRATFFNSAPTRPAGKG